MRENEKTCRLAKSLFHIQFSIISYFFLYVRGVAHPRDTYGMETLWEKATNNEFCETAAREKDGRGPKLRRPRTAGPLVPAAQQLLAAANSLASPRRALRCR